MTLLPQYLFLVFTIACANGARILAVLPMPARSHHQLFRAVLRTLAERGHEVVSYTTYLMDKPVANYTEIHLDTVESVEQTFTPKHLLEMMNMSPVAAAAMLWTPDTIITNRLFVEIQS